jgi:hypothetical protein
MLVLLVIRLHDNRIGAASPLSSDGRSPVGTFEEQPGETMPGMKSHRRTASGPRSAVVLVGLGLVLFSVCCGPGTGIGHRVLDPFLADVQNENLDGLYCQMTGASESEDLGADDEARRAGFEVWARTLYDAYEQGREEGWVELDEHGISAVKLFALGKGTFFEISEARQVGPDAIRVRMELRFGYASIDLSRFSPGTTFYVCGVPPGRVHAIRKPAGRAEESAEVLDRLSLEWTLVRKPAAGGCPEGWTVASVVPVEQAWSSRQVTWVF